MIKKNVLIIGIDGGTWKILKPAMDEGHMPYLKSLVEAGASGILESTMPAITPAAWGSFQTGMNPGKTGVFDFVRWDKKAKKTILVNSKFLRRTLWDMVSDAGKRVGVLNVPMTYPPRPINGYMVTGILTPSLDSDFTYPPELKFELLKAVPDYHIFNLENVKEGFPHKHFKSFVQRMVEIVDSRAKAARFIIEKGPLDVFMIHFFATDVIQHVMWGYIDEDHPLYDPAKREYIFKHFYKQLDQKIQEVRQSFEKTVQGEYITFIISDHGFQTHKKRFNLGNWLCQEGYLKVNIEMLQKPRVVRLVQKIDKFNLRKYLVPKNVRSKVASSKSGNFFDWDNSRAFSIGRSNEGFIYLLEEDESKRDATATELIRKLSAIKDPENGMTVINRIYRKEEIFSGRYLDLMPDLIIEPADGYSITGYYQPNAGLFHKVNIKDDFHIGKHHKDGILVVVGEGIKQQDNVRAKIIDIVPTILYYLRLPIPRNIDGRVLKELFGERF